MSAAASCCSRRIPGQVLAELNSTAPGASADARALEERIHEMLFAETIEAPVARP